MGDEDKQFEATPTKLNKARKEGQVVKSKDFSTAMSLLIMFSVLNAMSPMIWQQCCKLFILIYEQIPKVSIDKIGAQYLFVITIVPTAIIIFPILFAAAFVGIMGDLIQVGPLFTTSPLNFKIDKLDPFKGFKNIFMSMKTYFELLKNVVKVIILGIIGYMIYKSYLPDILKLCTISNTFSVLFVLGQMTFEFVRKAGMIFLVIAAADYGFTRWKFMKDQKMSFKEMKDEYKNSEGDPHVKQALRQKRQQMMQRSMLEAVPSADFVTTNPTHIAVALRYNTDEMKAPRVIAKGTELFAKKIIAVAKEHNVPVIENPPVARALFRFVDVNMEIPPELYKAVAEILMFVYNLRREKNKNLPS